MLKTYGIQVGDDYLKYNMPEVSAIFKFFGFEEVKDLEYFKVILSRAEVVVLYRKAHFIDHTTRRAKLELVAPTLPGEDPHYDICKFLGLDKMRIQRATLVIEMGNFATMDLEIEPAIDPEARITDVRQTYYIKDK